MVAAPRNRLTSASAVTHAISKLSASERPVDRVMAHTLVVLPSFLQTSSIVSLSMPCSPKKV